jgi:hypothetical protein
VGSDQGLTPFRQCRFPQAPASAHTRSAASSAPAARLRSRGFVGARTTARSRRSPENEAVVIGSVVGSYLIQEKLGEGGMGEVYRARDSRLKRDVAIKVLPASFADDPNRVTRLLSRASLGWREALQLFTPIEDDVDLGRRRITRFGLASRYDYQEFLTVPGDVVGAMGREHLECLHREDALV